MSRSEKKEYAAARNFWKRMYEIRSLNCYGISVKLSVGPLDPTIFIKKIRRIVEFPAMCVL